MLALPQLGELFEGRYELGGELGSGGFALVFSATDVRTQQRVALKVLKPNKRGQYAQDLERRFERELLILKQLDSPHIVALRDYGRTARGLLYLVMELVPGVDLSTYLGRHGRMSPAQVVRVLRQLLAALGAAHGAGVLHRDLKPDNIRVFATAQDPLNVKLLDFGIARHGVTEASIASVTRTGQIIGTPRYMSPEQLAERDLTPASDIYSLGIVAFEMLTAGEGLHGNAWGDQIERLKTGHSFSYSDGSEVGTRLLAVVQQMTERDTSKRLGSVNAVLRALDAFHASPAPSREPQTLPRIVPDAQDEATTRKHRRRSSLIGPLIAVAALGTVGGVIALTTTRNAEVVEARPTSAASPALTQRSNTTAGPDVKPADVGEADLGYIVAVESNDWDREANGQRLGCGRKPFVRGLWHGVGSEAERKRPQGFTWIPRDYDENHKYPVLILGHASEQNGLFFLESTGFIEVAGHEAIIISPSMPPYTRTALTPQDERAQIPEVLNWYSDHFCIDPYRVFLVAHGSSGIVVDMHRCDRFLAAAVVSDFLPLAPITQQLAETLLAPASDAALSCSDRAPVPAMLFTSPSEGRRRRSWGRWDLDRLSPQEYEERWRQSNECSEQAPIVTNVDGYERREFNECAAPLVAWRNRASKPWPTGPASADTQGASDLAISQSRIVWAFLRAVEPAADHKNITWKPRSPLPRH